MKKILNFIKIIILIILIVLLFFLNTYKKFTKEGFYQNAARIVAKYFNIDYDYYGFTREEITDDTDDTDPDSIILEIGSAFGEVDYKRIPWDTENRQLSVSEALWGVVPPQAQTAIFRKMYLASQLQDIASLPFDDAANKFIYEDPIFQYGTEDTELAKGLQAASALTTLLVPMTIGMLGANAAEDTIRNFLEKLPDRISKKAQEIKGSGISGVSMAKKTVTPEVLNKNKLRMNSVFDKDGKPFEPSPYQADSKAKIKTFNPAAKPNYLFQKAGDIKNRAPPSRFFKKISKIFKVLFKNKFMMILFKAFMMKFAILTSLAWLPVIGPTIDSLYNFLVTPLLIILTIPGPTGIIQQALDRMGDAEGCCPPGTNPLDQVIPRGAMTALSFIPVFGDILDLLYPYVCQDQYGGLVMKSKYYNKPKWLYHSWLSCQFFDWPPFNCRMGIAKMQGKYLTSEIQIGGSANYPTLPKAALTDSNLDTTTQIKIPSYVWGRTGLGTSANQLADVALQGLRYAGIDPPSIASAPFTNLDDVAANHTQYKFTNVFLRAFNKETEDYFILDPDTKFYYIDFSNPNILIKMAQFYYDFATKNPFPAEDGSLNYSYISKINYVIGSSLFTCDILCELTNVKYFLNNPGKITETVTFGHDRRFYFSCNPAANAPPYWENSSDATWKTLDDAYDAALFRLGDYISPENFKNDYFSTEYLVTAYEVRDRAYDRFITLSNSGNINSSDLLIFNQNYLSADSNFKAIIDDIKRKTSQPSPLTLQQSNTIFHLCSNVVKAKDDLWNLQLQKTPIDLNYVHPQYKLYGCTHLDSTAGSVLDPDIVELDIDYRKKVDFNVTPYLKRCEGLHITTRQCIDLSNVEIIIKKYKEKYPNVNINTIHNIKAKGKNTCQFVWDQQVIGQAAITRVTNNILYQQDLSSCAFILPTNLIGGNVKTIASDTLTADNSVTTYTGNVSPNPPLSFIPASYIPPFVETLQGGLKKIYFRTQDRVLDGEDIPRFDLSTGARLPDLIRPKRPIRVTYPQQPQANLGNQSSNYCSRSETVSKFLLDYNATNADKILKVIRTFTTSSNVCDMEVDVLSGTGTNRTVQRKTVSYKMKEGFQNRYTYDSINNNNGLNIQKNTDYKYDSNFNNTYSAAYLSNFTPSVLPNVTFFNDTLVSRFTSSAREIASATNNMLVSLIGAQNLGDNPACGNCTDEKIKQRILEQYNLDNTDLGRYKSSKDKIRAIFKSAPFDANSCHIYYAQNQDYYADKFARDLNSPSNYQFRDLPIGLTKVRMMRDTSLPGCEYKPIPRQAYLDISASDPSLQTGVDIKNTTSFFYPKRQMCDNLVCTNRSLFNQASNDFHRKTDHRITNVAAMLKTNFDTCDYLIRFNYRVGTQGANDLSGVLRVRYEYPLYNSANQACSAFTFSSNSSVFVNDLSNRINKSNNIELQFGGNVNEDDPDISPLLTYKPSNMTDPMNALVRNTFI